MGDKKKIVIQSLRNKRYLDTALKSNSDYVLLTQNHIGNLESFTKIFHKNNKKVGINMDLLGGFSGDNIGIELLKNQFKIDFVIVSSQSKIDTAKKHGLETIQLITLMDSLSLDKGIKIVKNSQADFIELRPYYYALKYIDTFKKLNDKPFIAGGFICSQGAIDEIYKAGFEGYATSDPTFWL